MDDCDYVKLKVSYFASIKPTSSVIVIQNDHFFDSVVLFQVAKNFASAIIIKIQSF